MKKYTLSPVKTLVSTSLLLSGITLYPTHAQAGFQWVAPSDASAMQQAPVVVSPPVQQMPVQRAPMMATREPEVISPVVIQGQAPQQNYQPAPAPVRDLPEPMPVQVSQPQPLYQQQQQQPQQQPMSASSEYMPANQMPDPVPQARYYDNSAPVPLTASAPEPMPMPAQRPVPAPAPMMAAQMAPTPVAAPASMDRPVQGFANNVPLSVALRQILPPDYGFSMSQDVDLSTLVSWRGGRPWRETLQAMLQTVGLTMQEQAQMINVSHLNGYQQPSAMPPVVSNPQPGTYAPMEPVIDHTMQAPIGAMVGEPVMAQPPTPTGPIVDTWTANRGDTLRKVLEDWTHRANIELSWLAEYDYPIQASVVMTGSFEDAVRNLLTGFQEAKPQPFASLHNNPGAGQTVLVVETRGNNYSD